MQSNRVNIFERFHKRRWRVLAIVLLAIGIFGTYRFFWHSYSSFVLLRSAYEVGLPSASSVRGWMTLDYISNAYDVPLDRLVSGLDLPETTDPDTPLFEIAMERNQPPLEFDMVMQIVIAEGAAVSTDGEVVDDDTDETEETSLSALLTYSYPALGLILLLGALGAPVPSGIATVVAGVLASDGTMDWPLATGIVVVASVSGDVVGYGVGRYASENFISRFGRYVGFSGKYRIRVENLFARWGGLTIFLTRTLVSTLSSIASLFAGLTRFTFAVFLAFAVAGRILWTSAYFSAGYYLGTDFESSSLFLRNVTGLLLSASLTGISAYYLVQWWRSSSSAA